MYVIKQYPWVLVQASTGVLIKSHYFSVSATAVISNSQSRDPAKI